MYFPVLIEGQRNGLKIQQQSPRINELGLCFCNQSNNHTLPDSSKDRYQCSPYSKFYSSSVQPCQEVILVLLSPPGIIGPAVNDLTAHSFYYDEICQSSFPLHMEWEETGVGLSKPAHHGTISCTLTNRRFSTLGGPWIKLH